MSGPANPLDEIQRCLAAGRHDAAADVAIAAMRKDARNPQLPFYLGLARRNAARHADAERAFTQAVRLRPNVSDFHFELARTRVKLQKHDAAMGSIDRALELRPGEPDYVAEKARLLRLRAQHDEAWALIAPRIDGGDRTPSIVAAYGALAGRYDRAEHAAELVSALIEDGSRPRHERAAAGFILGDLLRGLERWDDAFDAYRRANADKGVTFDLAGHLRAIEDVIRTWTPERLDELAEAASMRPVDADLPVLIVGMPRSGTTLIEQIIDAHPDAAGAGELTLINETVAELLDPTRSYAESIEGLRRPRLDKAARRYVKHLRKVDRTAKRITDKMPQNFLHLGVVSRMFPDARVIHAQRNPLDTCLSCYFMNFDSPIRFIYDLETLGAYCRSCERLMEHWKRVLDLPILDVQYEQVVEDQQAQTERILDFLDLPWDDACLRFHESDRIVTTASAEQVKRPLYARAVHRYKRYEKHLGPLKDALGLN